MSAPDRVFTGRVGWLVGGLVAVSYLIAVWGLSQIPAGEQIPIHWNAAGVADGFGSRWWLLASPLIFTGVVGLVALIARIEPRREHMVASLEPLRTLLVVMAGFGVLITLATTLAAVGRAIDVGAWVSVGVGALIAVIGNLLGKIRSTYTFGVRTPWTLASERSWQRTHRMTGFIWVVVGLATVVLGLVGMPETAIWVLLGGLLGSLVFALWYSYVVWRDDPDKRDGP